VKAAKAATTTIAIVMPVAGDPVLRTAKALGVTIPSSLLLRADEVVQ